MYICVIVSTVDVNEYIFCVNEQQKVYVVRGKVTSVFGISEYSFKAGFHMIVDDRR